MPADIKGSPSEVTDRCAVDIVNDPVKDELIAINRVAGLKIYGWALDDKSTSVPSIVFLHLLKGTENYYGRLNRRVDRVDLAKAFGKQEFINAGYGGNVDISSLPAGAIRNSHYSKRRKQKLGMYHESQAGTERLIAQRVICYQSSYPAIGR